MGIIIDLLAVIRNYFDHPAHHWQSQYNRHLNSLSTPANSISLANSIWSLCENFFDILNCDAAQIRKHTVKISFLRQCGKKNHPTFTLLGKMVTKKDGWPKMTSEKNMVGQNPPGEGGHEAVLRWKKKVANGHLDHHHQSSWSSSSSSSSLANQW